MLCTPNPPVLSRTSFDTHVFTAVFVLFYYKRSELLINDVREESRQKIVRRRSRPRRKYWPIISVKTTARTVLFFPWRLLRAKRVKPSQRHSTLRGMDAHHALRASTLTPATCEQRPHKRMYTTATTPQRACRRPSQRACCRPSARQGAG